MGSVNSRHQTKDRYDNVDLSAPKINYMRVNYSDSSVKQINIWMTESSFPSTESFSIRQLNQLRERLQEKEQETENKKDKSKLITDRKAFSLWMKEAQNRDRRPQAGTGRISSVSQCVKMQDSELDRVPPRRRIDPPQQQDEQQPELVRRLIHGQEHHRHITLTVLRLRFPSSTLIHLSYQDKAASPSHTRSGLVWEGSQNPSVVSMNPFITLPSPVRTDTEGNMILNLPMMEVAGADGHAMLIHRPWTMEDVKQATTHLSSPSDGGIWSETAPGGKDGQ